MADGRQIHWVVLSPRMYVCMLTDKKAKTLYYTVIRPQKERHVKKTNIL